jgi:hypothetical protein
MEINKKLRIKNQSRCNTGIIVGLAKSVPGAAWSKLYIGYGFANVGIGGDMDGVPLWAGVVRLRCCQSRIQAADLS